MSGGWHDLGLSPSLLSSLSLSYPTWSLPTSIQDDCIPLILGGGDCLGSAPTGSGKTGAFAVPAVAVCEEGVEREGRGDFGGMEDGEEGDCVEDVVAQGGGGGVGDDDSLVVGSENFQPRQHTVRRVLVSSVDRSGSVAVSPPRP